MDARQQHKQVQHSSSSSIVYRANNCYTTSAIKTTTSYNNIFISVIPYRTRYTTIPGTQQAAYIFCTFLVNTKYQVRTYFLRTRSHVPPATYTSNTTVTILLTWLENNNASEYSYLLVPKNTKQTSL